MCHADGRVDTHTSCNLLGWSPAPHAVRASSAPTMSTERGAHLKGLKVLCGTGTAPLFLSDPNLTVCACMYARMSLAALSGSCNWSHCKNEKSVLSIPCDARVCARACENCAPSARACPPLHTVTSYLDCLLAVSTVLLSCCACPLWQLRILLPLTSRQHSRRV